MSIWVRLSISCDRPGQASLVVVFVKLVLVADDPEVVNDLPILVRKI